MQFEEFGLTWVGTPTGAAETKGSTDPSRLTAAWYRGVAYSCGRWELYVERGAWGGGARGGERRDAERCGWHPAREARWRIAQKVLECLAGECNGPAGASMFSRREMCSGGTE